MGSKRISVRVLGLLAAAIHAGASARADVVSVTASADAFVTSAQPNGNFGGAGALAVSAPGLSLGEFQSVLRFSAGPVRAGFDALYGVGNWTITGASLQFTATFPNNPIFNSPAAGSFAARWMQNDSWVEGTGGPSAPSDTGIMFNTLPSFLSPADESLGTYAYDGATSGQTSYALSLTPGFVTDLTAGGEVSLRLLAADDAVSYVFNSRNFGGASSRPILSVTAIPEPASFVLLAAGGFAGGWVRGRRRAG